MEAVDGSFGQGLGLGLGFGVGVGRGAYENTASVMKLEIGDHTCTGGL